MTFWENFHLPLCLTCRVSLVKCHMSCIICHMWLHYIYFFYKVLELVCWASVINGSTPSSLWLPYRPHCISLRLLAAALWGRFLNYSQGGATSRLLVSVLVLFFVSVEDHMRREHMLSVCVFSAVVYCLLWLPRERGQKRLPSSFTNWNLLGVLFQYHLSHIFHTCTTYLICMHKKKCVITSICYG